MSETTAPAVTLVEFLERRLDQREKDITDELEADDPSGRRPVPWWASAMRTDIQIQRRIIADEAGYLTLSHPTTTTLRLLALPYAGHAQYNPDWRPDE